MKDDLIERTVSDIEFLLKLKPNNVWKADEFGQRIIESAKKIQNLIRKKKVKGEYRDILAIIDKHAGKLSLSVLNANKGKFRQDWIRFAKQDFRRLRDEVLALRVFMAKHRKELQRSLFESKYGADIERLIEYLHEEGALHRLTYSRTIGILAEMGESELGKVRKDSADRIVRLSRWLSTLRRIRHGSSCAR